MRIPSVLRTTAKNHALRKWVDGKKCPREDYFTSIDGMRTIWLRHAGQGGSVPDYDYEGIASSLARLLDREGALYDYVAGNNQSTEDENVWTSVLLAAAWVLLERYEQAVANGTWKPAP